MNDFPPVHFLIKIRILRGSVLPPSLHVKYKYWDSFRLKYKRYYNYVHRCGTDGGSMRACQATGPDSIPGRDKFPGWGFSEFFFTCKTCQEALGPTGPRISFGRNNPFISALFEWMGAWMVCIAFLVHVVSEVSPALCSSLIRGGFPCPCVVKKSMYIIQR